MNPAYLRWNEAYRDGHVDRDEDPEEEPHLPRRTPLPRGRGASAEMKPKIELRPEERDDKRQR
jgi:hypothetical protein